MSQSMLSFDDQDRDRAGRAGRQADRTLVLLMERAMTTLELQAEVGPRPAAYVNELRNRGHVIDTEVTECGVALYSHRGFSERVKVSDAVQAAYYATAHWRDRRHSRLSVDTYRCSSCGGSERLQVHHWCYDLFAEDLCDLMTLCEACHKRIHSYDNVLVHFPRYLTPEVANRISLAIREEVA